MFVFPIQVAYFFSLIQVAYLLALFKTPIFLPCSLPYLFVLFKNCICSFLYYICFSYYCTIFVCPIFELYFLALFKQHVCKPYSNSVFVCPIQVCICFLCSCNIFTFSIVLYTQLNTVTLLNPSSIVTESLVCQFMGSNPLQVGLIFIDLALIQSTLIQSTFIQSAFIQPTINIRKLCGK